MCPSRHFASFSLEDSADSARRVAYVFRRLMSEAYRCRGLIAARWLAGTEEEDGRGDKVGTLWEWVYMGARLHR